MLEFKGGVMGGEALTVEQLDALSRLPARDVLHGQLVGVVASPITGLVRGLNALIAGLAIQLAADRGAGPGAAARGAGAERGRPRARAEPAEPEAERRGGTAAEEDGREPAARRACRRGAAAEAETETNRRN